MKWQCSGGFPCTDTSPKFDPPVSHLRVGEGVIVVVVAVIVFGVATVATTDAAAVDDNDEPAVSSILCLYCIQ